MTSPPAEKKKRTMTPELLLKLASAREQAKIVQARNKSISDMKKEVVKQAKEDKKKNIISDHEKMLRERKQSQELPQELPQEEEPPQKEPIVQVDENPTPVETKKKEKKKKKPIVIVQDSSSESEDEDDNIIYIKRKSNRRKGEVKVKVPEPEPTPTPPMIRRQMQINPFHTIGYRFNNS